MLLYSAKSCLVAGRGICGLNAPSLPSWLRIGCATDISTSRGPDTTIEYCDRMHRSSAKHCVSFDAFDAAVFANLILEQNADEAWHFLCWRLTASKPGLGLKSLLGSFASHGRKLKQCRSWVPFPVCFRFFWELWDHQRLCIRYTALAQTTTF